MQPKALGGGMYSGLSFRFDRTYRFSPKQECLAKCSRVVAVVDISVVACNFSDGTVVDVDERAIQTEDQPTCCFLIRYYLLLTGGAGGNIP